MNSSLHATVPNALRNQDLPAFFRHRRLQWHRISVVALGVLLAGSLHPASANTYSYTGGGTGSATSPITGSFSNGFSPSITSAGYTDTLSFAGGSYTATDDVGQQILANMLTFSNSGTVALARGAGSNSISLGGANPAVTTSGGSVVNALDLSLAANATFNIGGGGMTQGGVISGIGYGIIKSGNSTGALTFMGASTYTGATNISAGILTAGIASVANVSGAFGNNSAITLANASGVGLYLTSTTGTTANNYDTQVGSLSGGGTFGGGVNLGSAVLTTGGDNTSTAYAGQLSGTNGKLTKIGAGTQTLSGTNSYTGGTNFNGGIINVSSTGALGNMGNLTFGGGALQYSAANQTDYSGRFISTGNQAYSIDTNGQTVSFAFGLTSTGGSLAKSGAGTLTLTKAGTYTGGTTVTGGTLTASATNALGTGALAVNNANTGAGTNVIVNFQASQTVNSLSSTVAMPTSGTNTAQVNITASNTLTDTQSGTTNYAGSVSGGTLSIAGQGSGASAATINYTGNDSAAQTNVNANATLQLNNAGGPALSGPVAVATSGTLTISANATNNEIATAAPPTTIPTIAAVTLNGGTLNANGSDGTLSSPTITATTTVGSSMGALALGTNGTQTRPSLLAFAGTGTTSNPIILAFADSSQTLGSGYLNITGYTGTTNALYIGTTSDLTPTQLKQIGFNGVFGATQSTTGEILASAPEPGEPLSLLAGAGGLGGLIWSRRKKAGQAAAAAD